VLVLETERFRYDEINLQAVLGSVGSARGTVAHRAVDVTVTSRANARVMPQWYSPSLIEPVHS
jgi:hypothetical protein